MQVDVPDLKSAADVFDEGARATLAGAYEKIGKTSGVVVDIYKSRPVEVSDRLRNKKGGLANGRDYRDVIGKRRWRGRSTAMQCTSRRCLRRCVWS